MKRQNTTPRMQHGGTLFGLVQQLGLVLLIEPECSRAGQCGCRVSYCSFVQRRIRIDPADDEML